MAKKKNKIADLKAKLEKGKVSQKQAENIADQIRNLGGKVNITNFGYKSAGGGAAKAAAPTPDPYPNPPDVAAATSAAKPIKDPGSVYTADQMAEIDESQKQIYFQNPEIKNPFGSQETKINDDGTVSVDQKLSAEQEKIKQQGEQLTKTGQEAAQGALSGYQKFNPNSSASAGFSAPSREGYQTFAPNLGYQAFQPQGFEGYQPFQGESRESYSPFSDSSRSSYSPFQFDSSDQGRQRIEDSVFQSLTRDLEENRGRDLEQKQQELYNKGIAYSDDPESRYQKELGDIQKRYDRQALEAKGQAVQMGGQEMQRQYGMGLGTHQQGMADVGQFYGQDLGVHQQGMADYGQRFGEDLASQQQRMAEQGQMYGQGLSTQQQRMGERGQLFGEGLAQHQQGMSDYGQMFGEDLAAAQQRQSEQGQAFGQELTTHQQGMADIGALQSYGLGLQMPQFQAYQGPNYDVADPSTYIYAGKELKQGNKALQMEQNALNQQNAIANKQLAQAAAASQPQAPQPPPFP